MYHDSFLLPRFPGIIDDSRWSLLIPNINHYHLPKSGSSSLNEGLNQRHQTKTSVPNHPVETGNNMLHLPIRIPVQRRGQRPPQPLRPSSLRNRDLHHYHAPFTNQSVDNVSTPLERKPSEETLHIKCRVWEHQFCSRI